MCMCVCVCVSRSTNISCILLVNLTTLVSLIAENLSIFFCIYAGVRLPGVKKKKDESGDLLYRYLYFYCFFLEVLLLLLLLLLSCKDPRMIPPRYSPSKAKARQSPIKKLPPRKTITPIQQRPASRKRPPTSIAPQSTSTTPKQASPAKKKKLDTGDSNVATLGEIDKRASGVQEVLLVDVESSERAQTFEMLEVELKRQMALVHNEAVVTIYFFASKICSRSFDIHLFFRSNSNASCFCPAFLHFFHCVTSNTHRE